MGEYDLTTAYDLIDEIDLGVGSSATPTTVIFDGTIKQIRRGRLNQTTSFLDIMAADGALMRYAVVTTTLAADTRYYDALAPSSGSWVMSQWVNPALTVTCPDNLVLTDITTTPIRAGDRLYVRYGPNGRVTDDERIHLGGVPHNPLAVPVVPVLPVPEGRGIRLRK